MSKKGIQHLVNADGEPEAVVINLKQHGEFLEDFFDALLVQERKDQPKETLESVKRRLGLTAR